MQYNQPYGVSDPNAPYINGNPSTGTPGSIPPAASIEFPQREIINLIADAGLVAPSNNDLHQLARSVQSHLLVSDDDVGTVNQLQVTMTPAPPAYFKYMMVVCKVAIDNTGPSTLNCNALGPRPIVHFDGSGLSKNELRAGSITCFEYDGTNFHAVWSTAGTAAMPGMPIYLLGDIAIYVNASTGSDTLYDGTSATVTVGTVHGPFQTIQHALDQVPLYNLNNHNIYINVANGGYSAFVARRMNGSGTVIMVGNTTTPTSVMVTGTNQTAAMFPNTGGPYSVDGFGFQSSGSSPSDACCCITLAGGSQVALGNIDLGPSPGAQVVVGQSSLLSNTVPNVKWTLHGTIAGNAMTPGAAFYALTGGLIQSNANGGPAIVCGTASYAGAFVWASSQGNIELAYSSLTGAGNVSGQRFNVSYLSIISSSGGGLNYFPGTVAGAQNNASGGFYA